MPVVVACGLHAVRGVGVDHGAVLVLIRREKLQVEIDAVRAEPHVDAGAGAVRSGRSSATLDDTETWEDPRIENLERKATREEYSREHSVVDSTIYVDRP